MKVDLVTGSTFAQFRRRKVVFSCLYKMYKTSEHHREMERVDVRIEVKSSGE